MAEGKPFDELWGSSRNKAARPGFEPLATWLADTPPAELARRQHAAEAAFRSLGITFSVYGEEEAAERIIPFDIVPRDLLRRRMGRGSPPGSSSGCGRSTPSSTTSTARGRSSPTASSRPTSSSPTRNIASPSPARAPPHGVYAHICGIDLIRTGPDEFYVLEDNARTPSGVSYMIENRDAMLRLCPELFDIFPVRPVDSYPELLRETLYSVAPRGGSREPRCVLLTPGHHNSAFYEHSFLADNMGIELVEGRDLEVDDDIVWMKTIDGRGAGRRHLPPDRRRLPRSARLPRRFAARRARADGRLSRRQRHPGERARHRHRRRQGDLFLHARDRPLLYRRGGEAAQCRDLALPRARRRCATRSTISTSWW